MKGGAEWGQSRQFLWGVRGVKDWTTEKVPSQHRIGTQEGASHADTWGGAFSRSNDTGRSAKPPSLAFWRNSEEARWPERSGLGAGGRR